MSCVYCCSFVPSTWPQWRVMFAGEIPETYRVRDTVLNLYKLWRDVSPSVPTRATRDCPTNCTRQCALLFVALRVLLLVGAQAGVCHFPFVVLFDELVYVSVANPPCSFPSHLSCQNTSPGEERASGRSRVLHTSWASPTFCDDVCCALQ